MQCQEIKELLSVYIDGMLDPSAKNKVDIHLEQCPACRSEFENLKMVVTLVHELPQVSPPADFRRNLRRRLEHMAGPGKKAGWIQRLATGRWSGIMAVAASFLLVIGIASAWYGMSGMYGVSKQPVQVSSYDAKENAAPVEVLSGSKGADGSRESNAITGESESSGSGAIVHYMRIKEQEADSGAAYSVTSDAAPAPVKKIPPPVTPPVSQENSTQERKLAVENGMAGVTARGVPAAPPAGQAEQSKQAVIDVKVEQKAAAVREIFDIARKYGGEALVLPDTGGREILVKVPGTRLEQAIADIGKTGRITRQEYPVQDVNKDSARIVTTAATPAPTQKSDGIEKDGKGGGVPEAPAPGSPAPGSTVQPAGTQGEIKKEKQEQPAVNGGTPMASIRVRLE
ncbi:MAG: zf-HC2 domain-containing protein [Bacillota bacterium]